MRRVFHAVPLVVCLAVAVGASGAPRGLLLAALAAGVAIARTLHAQQPQATTSRQSQHADHEGTKIRDSKAG